MLQGGYSMKISERLQMLRKQNGLSPLLGILLMALGLLAAGLAGLIRIRCMGRRES